MKQPIDPSEIREGDVIRYEYEAAATHASIAYEYRAKGDGDSYGIRGQHFLLHRPERMVQVPESAIEALREALHIDSPAHERIFDFLRAVDEAGDTDD